MKLWPEREFLKRSGSARKITCHALQWWQLNNSTKGPWEENQYTPNCKNVDAICGESRFDVSLCLLPAWSLSQGGLQQVETIHSKGQAGPSPPATPVSSGPLTRYPTSSALLWAVGQLLPGVGP